MGVFLRLFTLENISNVFSEAERQVWGLRYDKQSKYNKIDSCMVTVEMPKVGVSPNPIFSYQQDVVHLETT